MSDLGVRCNISVYTPGHYTLLSPLRNHETVHIYGMDLVPAWLLHDARTQHMPVFIKWHSSSCTLTHASSPSVQFLSLVLPWMQLYHIPFFHCHMVREKQPGLRIQIQMNTMVRMPLAVQDNIHSWRYQYSHRQANWAYTVKLALGLFLRSISLRPPLARSGVMV